jgi:hypothetical protein
MKLEEIPLFQPTQTSSLQPPPSFAPVTSDGIRDPSFAPAVESVPEFAAIRAVLARQNETNLQLSKEQLDFLHLLERNKASASISDICKFAGVSRPIFYRWRTNPRFSQAFGECIARGVFNDLSHVLRNELQHAIAGNRKADKATLQVFLSQRGFYHYRTILALLNSASRVTPIPRALAAIEGNARGSGPQPHTPKKQRRAAPSKGHKPRA